MSIDLVRIAFISVSAKTSKEARTAVSARAEGLPTWKPAAPGMGRKPGNSLIGQFELVCVKNDLLFPIENRVALSPPHHPLNRGR